MKFYSGPLSMFGAKAEIALREKGFDFELEMVPFEMKVLYEPKHPEVVRINPKRQVPVLAGSAAYALGEVRRWKIGLERDFSEARPFYITIAVAILAGLGVVLLPIDPIKALIWSAVLNGVIVVPIIGAMMIVASRRKIMGEFTASLWQRVLGWLTFVFMGAAAIGMFVLM